MKKEQNVCLYSPGLTAYGMMGSHKVVVERGRLSDRVVKPNLRGTHPDPDVKHTLGSFSVSNNALSHFLSK